jgi:hypothetical protein
MITASRAHLLRLVGKLPHTCEWVLPVLCLMCSTQSVDAASRVGCPPGVDPTASVSLADTSSGGRCTFKASHGYPLPDPACTPGAINPTVGLPVLQSGKFKTGCERDAATTSKQKQATYNNYAIKKPPQNTGTQQRCELDHLISLELGGSDTLDNIWPQCGPGGVALARRYFKIKDGVENYLALKVRTGEISLKEAQQGIAKDWTQFVAQSTAYWSKHVAGGFGRDE